MIGPGSILGQRYRLERPLAAGGMGTVWVAEHVDLETRVAVKLVDGAYARRPDLLERFRREARAAAQLKTPHVVQILDYGVDEGVPYIAMELLEGEDLETALEREGTLDPVRLGEILRPVCRALGIAHTAGIVHRDLKPANVFIARIAGDEVVKLLDFGIAKELHRGAEWSTGAAMVGSPLFMSPEQIAGASQVDARSDLWSLGVMTYLMLFGEPPFQGDGVPAVLYRIAHAPFDQPSSRSPALAPFDAFFARALARKPADRYATVSDFQAGFEAAVGALDDPTLAVAPSAGPAARSGTVAMAPGEGPLASGAGLATAVSAPPLMMSSPGDDDAATRAQPSDVPANARGSDIPAPPPRVAASRRGEPRGSPWGWITGGAVIVVGVIAVVVARSGDGAPPSGHRGDFTDTKANAARGPAPTATTAVASAVAPAAAHPSVAEPALSAEAGSAPTASAAVPPRPVSSSATSPKGVPASAPAKPPSSGKPPAAKPPGGAHIDPEWGVQVPR